MSISLYDLTDAWLNLQALEQDEDIVAALEMIEGDIEQKLVNISKVVRNLQAQSNAILAEERRLHRRKESADKNAERLMEYARQTMIATNRKAVTDGISGFRVQANPPKVVVDADAEIPLSYYHEIPPSRQLDKTSLKQALQAGLEVPGVRLESEIGLRLK